MSEFDSNPFADPEQANPFSVGCPKQIIIFDVHCYAQICILFSIKALIRKHIYRTVNEVFVSRERERERCNCKRARSV